MTIPAQLTVPENPDQLSSPGPFEGPEKLLEIWFAPSSEALPAESSTSGLKRREGNWKGLRCVPREVWEEMLDIVKCKVLSVVEGDELDAYLLSESSLFVAPHLLILKTCGTTLNLLGLYRIIEIAREHCGFRNVWRCFYSRKSFFFPERQSGPHRDWRDEVNFLDSVFGSAGSAYTVGPMNRDHWLLYLTTPNSQPLLPGDSSLDNQSFRLSLPPPSTFTPSPYQDTTLEILMSHLEPAGREPFFHGSSESSSPKSGHELGRDISSSLGIDKLFDKSETRLDSFGFEPCGYSANAVIGTGMPDDGGDRPGGGYYTIHVTPEEGWSYASFECNVPLEISPSASTSTSNTTSPSKASTSAQNGSRTRPRRPSLTSLIRNVVSIFQPNRLSITLFVSTPASTTLDHDDSLANGDGDGENVVGLSEPEQRAWKAFSNDLLGRGYERKDRIGYEFDGYDLVFACFERKGWKEPKKAITV